MIHMLNDQENNTITAASITGSGSSLKSNKTVINKALNNDQFLQQVIVIIVQIIVEELFHFCFIIYFTGF